MQSHSRLCRAALRAVLGSSLALATVVGPSHATANSPQHGRRQASAIADEPDPRGRTPGGGTFKVTSRKSWTNGAAGGLNIVADLKNTTKRWRGDVRIVMQYRNARGRVIDNELDYADALAIRPGGHIPVELWDSSPPRRYHRVTLQITSKPTKLRIAKRMKITVGKPFIKYGIFKVPVKVRNRNRFPVKHVYVSLTLFDRSGRIVNADADGYNYTKPGKLRPGQVGKMTGVFGAHYLDAHRVRVQVEAFAT